MKQDTITLKEAIKLFPVSWNKIEHQEIPDNFKALSFIEKVKYIGEYNTQYILSVKENGLFYGLKRSEVKRSGRNIYTKSEWDQSLIIVDNKISLKNATIPFVVEFLNIININFFRDFNHRELIFLVKPFMISAILRKKVYGLETFYRQILTCSYKLPDFDWRLFRKYINCNFSGISFLDMKCFTRNLNDSLKVVVNLAEKDWEKHSFLIDMLRCAVKLDEIVDFTWSESRIHAEHNRQNSKLKLIEISNKKDTPVFDTTIGTDCIKLLNTEKEVFLEGDVMHHCIYSCYWKEIQNKEHIAFHMTFPEDCTFSFKKKSSGELFLYQIFLAYDKPVQPETKEIVLKFMNDNYNAINHLISNKKDNSINDIPDLIF